MAIRPPRQRTTFDKKGKGTTTYRAPEMERASEQLDRYTVSYTHQTLPTSDLV